MAQPAFRAAKTMRQASYAIQHAHILDIWGVFKLERACFGAEDGYGLDTLFTLLLTPSNTLFKAMMNRKLVGFVAGEFEYSQQAGWIITIGVLPDYAGRGIGAALLNAAEQKLFEQVSRVKLTVRRSNERAINLYSRTGYRWVTTYQHYYRDGEDGLVMEKTAKNVV